MLQYLKESWFGLGHPSISFQDESKIHPRPLKSFQDDHKMPPRDLRDPPRGVEEANWTLSCLQILCQPAFFIVSSLRDVSFNEHSPPNNHPKHMFCLSCLSFCSITPSLHSHPHIRSTWHCRHFKIIQHRPPGHPKIIWKSATDVISLSKQLQDSSIRLQDASWTPSGQVQIG